MAWDVHCLHEDPTMPATNEGHQESACFTQCVRVVCFCWKVYIRITKLSGNTHITEHQRHCCLGQPEKLAAAEHVCPVHTVCHTVLFVETQFLSSTCQYFAWLYREANKLFKHDVLSTNRHKETLTLSKYWWLVA